MAMLSMNETTTYRWSFEEDVAQYAAAGIPAIGVWRQKLGDCGMPRAAELLAKHRLKVSHLSWAGGFTGSDGRTYRESLDDAREALHLAAAIKADNLIVYSGPRAGHTHNHARRLFRDALAQLATEAEPLGVQLAVEPMNAGCAAAWTFLTSLDDTLAVIDAVGSPRVKMVFDTYHFGHDPAVLGRLAELAGKIALVQLGDGRQPPTGEQSRCRLGEGRLPLRDLVAALRQAGFDGYFDVELLGEEIEVCDYQSLLTHARQAYAQFVDGAACSA